MKKKKQTIFAGQDDQGQLVTWKHPGGKLLQLGPEVMTDAELLAIIIGSGNKNLTALEIAEEILRKFNSYKGIAGQEMTAFLEIKGIDKVRFTRIAACWAIAGRIVKKVLEDQEKYGEK